jgi:hypothetical protein
MLLKGKETWNHEPMEMAWTRRLFLKQQRRRKKEAVKVTQNCAMDRFPV